MSADDLSQRGEPEHVGLSGMKCVFVDHLHKSGAQRPPMAVSDGVQRRRWLAAAALLLLSIGTVAYRFLEDWTWVDSSSFSSIAVTAVGFGDLVPSTDAAKLLTVA